MSAAINGSFNLADVRDLAAGLKTRFPGLAHALTIMT